MRAIGSLLSIAAIISFLVYMNVSKEKFVYSKINKALHFADTSQTENERTIIRIIPSICMMQLLTSLSDSLLKLEASEGSQKLFDSSFKLNFRLKDSFSGYNANPNSIAYTRQVSFDTVSLPVRINKNYINNNTQITYVLTINGQRFETTTNGGYGVYDLNLLGNCDSNKRQKITIDYYPGYYDDTAKIFKGAKKWSDSMNINIHKITRDHIHANYIIFGEGIDSAIKYEVTSVLVNAGFPLKQIYDKIGGDSRNKIEINGIDSIENKPAISQDSLRCRYKNECGQQVIQIIYNNLDSVSEINQLASCIRSNKISTALSIRASSNFPKNVIRYYRTSLTDSLKSLQACLKTYFTNRTFFIEKSVAPLRQNAAVQIYIGYYEPKRPTVATVYKSSIENVKYPTISSSLDTIDVSFDVAVNQTVQAQTRQLTAQLALSKAVQGKICVGSDAGNCTDFSIPAGNGRTHVSRRVDLRGKASGKYGLRVLISDLKIDTLLGSFTISPSTNNQEQTFKLGQEYGGGIIFYLDASGKHGWIAAKENQSDGAKWSNGKFILTHAIDNNDGKANTDLIILKQGAGNYAAKICRDYKGGGFNDWFLPSKNQIYQMYINRSFIGNFKTNCDNNNFGECSYWSSTENGLDFAWNQYFVSGVSWNNYGKDGICPARAIRSF